MHSPGFRLFLALLALSGRRRAFASGETLAAALEDTRRVGPATPGFGLRRRLKVRSDAIDDRTVWTLAPRKAQASGVRVLWFHGGAYVRPVTAWHWRFLAALVEASGATAIAPNYPLAPRHSAERAVAFAREVWAACVDDGVPTVLAGDSAGGGLATALCLALRDAGAPMPAHLLLVSPWLDVATDHLSVDRIAPDDPLLQAPGLREAGRWYAGPLALHHSLVSPLHADLHGLPPATVYAGTRDILHADGTRFVSRMREAGGTATLHEGAGMIHAWPLLPFAEGRRARDEIAALLRRPGG